MPLSHISKSGTLPKNGQSYYGYKNHIDIDVKHKLIRNYAVTDASVHDSQVMNELLDPHNTSTEVYGDSAYRSEEQERELVEAGYRSKIHHKGKRNKPLSKHKQKVNKNRSRVCIWQSNDDGRENDAMHR